MTGAVLQPATRQVRHASLKVRCTDLGESVDRGAHREVWMQLGGATMDSGLDLDAGGHSGRSGRWCIRDAFEGCRSLPLA